ncbi:hypothetical protein [Sorangium sp. So ce1000]|uniref:hypothetical protein n=1 Tax=Sorangium sp. So ce1000 TaxID=3133325 RepID=UPI003F5DBF55
MSEDVIVKKTKEIRQRLLEISWNYLSKITNNSTPENASLHLDVAIKALKAASESDPALATLAAMSSMDHGDPPPDRG